MVDHDYDDAAVFFHLLMKAQTNENKMGNAILTLPDPAASIRFFS